MNRLAFALILFPLAAAAQFSHILIDLEEYTPGASASAPASIALYDEATYVGEALLLRFEGVPGTFTVEAGHLAQGPAGTGSAEAYLESVNLVVDPAFTGRVASFAYADFGGQVFFGLEDGWDRYEYLVDDFDDLPGNIAGFAVEVTRYEMGGYHFGTVSLRDMWCHTPRFDRIVMGGEDLMLDDVSIGSAAACL